jgi:thiamine pyridinylase
MIVERLLRGAGEPIMNHGLHLVLRLGLLVVVFLSAAAAQAGQLVLRNGSNAPVTCTVDGWTMATGFQFNWQITVQPNQSFNVGQNTTRAGPAVINWASCGSLTTRAMNITPTSPDGLLIFNGQQTRVLNVALYPYIPTLPPGTQFTGLVTHVIETYQQQNPQVLLAAQMNQETNIYSFTELPQLLGAQGLDVIELDTLYMGFLVSQNLVNPAQIAGEAPLPVATAASTINNQLWGIPSWLCMDFVYSGNQGVQQATTLTNLLQFLGQMPQGAPEMVGDYNGSWRLPSIYINAYVQQYGYGQIAQAMQMPPDPDSTVITNLVNLTNTCANAGTNNCTNGIYHNSPNGTPERTFATGNAGADIGFSEQSFFVNYYGPVNPLYAVPAAWGANPQPLLFSDTFVTSLATCANGSQCATDAAALTTLMTGLPMKNYIVQSQDLPPGTPWRTLLVAAASFYQQPVVQANPMYQQYQRIFQAQPAPQPFPNTFTAAIQSQMALAVCQALKQQQPQYVCNSSASAAASGARAQEAMQ